MKSLLTGLILLLASLSAGQAQAEGEFWEYTFRPGDSLWSIAEKYTTSAQNWSEIQRINQIRQGNNRRIQPGTRIVIPVALLKNQPTPAKVIALTGQVQILRANGEHIDASVGMELYSGDRVITENRQSLRMQFADRSELQVLGDSELQLDKLSYHGETGMVDTRVRLNRGRASSQVQTLKSGSHYQIQTPVATTAVRGTAFRLSFADDISRTEVTEGKVGVRAGDSEQLVPAGFGLVAEQGKPLSAPVKLLEPPQSLNSKPGRRSALLQWQALPDAQAYRYQLARDDSFRDILLDNTTSQTQVGIGDLTVGQYYWRVRAIGPQQLEGKSAQARFVLAPAPLAPAGPDAGALAPVNTMILNL